MLDAGDTNSQKVKFMASRFRQVRIQTPNYMVSGSLSLCLAIIMDSQNAVGRREELF